MKLRRLLELLAPEAAPLTVAALCMLVLAVTTAGAAALGGPVLQALVTSAPSPSALGPLSGLLPGAPWALPGLLVGLAALKGLAYFGQFHLMARAGQRTASRLRRGLLHALLGASPEALGQRQTGELLAHFVGDATAVEMAVTYALSGYVRDTATAALLFAVCLATDWRLSLVACAALPLTLLPLARLLKRLRGWLKQASQSRGALGHLVAEGLQGLPSIQVDGLEEREAARFGLENQRALRSQIGSAEVRARMGPLTEVAVGLGLCGMLLVASSFVANGRLTGAQLVSFLVAALLLAQPLKALGKVGHFLVAGQIALARLDALVASLRPAPRDLGAPLADGQLREGLRLSDVSYRYRPGDPPALDQVSFQVAAGEHVAIVGASGAGKSTLFQLLLGLRATDAGQIAYDRRPLEALALDDLYRRVGWMGQDPFLFEGTIAENIALGESHPDPARLRQTALRAQALPFIERAGGFEAQVGERGRRFSGGERQRLCLARALYQDASLILLDEPTSHLDAETEAALQDALRELLPGRTALIIAHRLATVRACGRAIVLERGRILEDGAPDELLRRGGPFAALFHLPARSPA